MFGSNPSGGAAPANEVDAMVTFSPTAAGALTAASATLPAGATGIPVSMKVVGSVGGYVTLGTTGQQTIAEVVAPNAPATTRPIPPAAFPGAVGSVQIGGYAFGAGSIAVAVRFRLK